MSIYTNHVTNSNNFYNVYESLLQAKRSKSLGKSSNSVKTFQQKLTRKIRGGLISSEASQNPQDFITSQSRPSPSIQTFQSQTSKHSKPLIRPLEDFEELNPNKFNFQGLLSLGNKSVASKDFHIVTKKPTLLNSGKSNLSPGQEMTPKYQENFTFEDFCIETPGFTEEVEKKTEDQVENTDQIFKQNLKYGTYEELVNFYESEKQARQHFEELYEKLVVEVSQVTKSRDLLGLSVDQIKRELQQIDYFKEKLEEMTEEVEKLREALKEAKEDKRTCKSCQVYINEIQSLRERIERARYQEELQKTKQANISPLVQNPSNPCKSCESLQSKLLKSESEVQVLQSSLTSLKKCNIFSSLVYSTSNQCQNCLKLTEKNSEISESFHRERKRLTTQVKTLQYENERILQTSPSEQCSMCDALRLEALDLQKRISFLKSRNFDLALELKQVKRKDDSQALLTRAPSKIPQDSLEKMKKQEVLEEFLSLKKEFELVSNSLLAQADEMFEKKKEISDLRRQKTELYKELVTSQSVLTELNELKEHVAYLLNFIHDMKEKIARIGQLYKESIQKNKELEESDDYKVSLGLISEIIQSNILTIAEKKKNKLNWTDDRGKANLVSYLKYSLLGYCSEE